MPKNGLPRRQIVQELQAQGWKRTRKGWASPHHTRSFQDCTLREAASLEGLTSCEDLSPKRRASKALSLQGLRLSPWITVDEFCATRVIEGTDPAEIKNRIAFIEKTPRVLIGGKWVCGPKGRSGPNGADPAEGLYGFDPRSREWADNALRQQGAILG
jgi:hypothetical protein